MYTLDAPVAWATAEKPRRRLLTSNPSLNIHGPLAASRNTFYELGYQLLVTSPAMRMAPKAPEPPTPR
jgi:hypothetical protein